MVGDVLISCKIVVAHLLEKKMYFPLDRLNKQTKTN
jgi:hypothetical protein